MKTLQTRPGFSLKIVVLALLAAFGSAHAADDEIAALIRPDSSVSIGAAGVTGAENERSFFGQYNGLRRQDAYLLLDLDVIKRDDATGTWTTFQGRNLGLDTREIRFGQQKQGDWKYSFEYDEMIRRDPRTINTSLVGAGSTAPVVSRLATAGSGSDVNLDLKRKNTTIALEKWLSPSLQFEALFARGIESLLTAGQGRTDAAETLRQRAFDEAPASTGSIDGRAFEWIADADMRLGPVCEAVINGRYYWLPFTHLARVVIEAPQDLRDAVWMPTHFEFTNGGEAVGVIPTRYPGSELHADPLVRLARKTEWVESPAGVFCGQGQRILTTDSGDFPLMDVREIVLSSAAAAGGETRG